MPTPTMPEEDLDSLFRRVAYTYPADMPPAAGAWERLASRLDTATAATAPPLRRKITRVFAVEVALLLFLAWQSYLLGQRPAVPVAGRPAVAERAARAAAPAALGGATPAVANPLASVVVTDRVEVSLNHKLLKAESLSGKVLVRRPTQAVGRRMARRLLLAANGGEVGFTRQKRVENTSLAKTLTTRLAPAAGRRKAYWQRKPAEMVLANYKALDSKSVASRAATSPDRSAPSYDRLVFARPRPLPVAGHRLPDSLAQLAPPPLPDSAAANKPAAPRPACRLVLGVLGAPSLSGVRTPQSAQLGGDYGLTLEYRLTNRLRVRAGVVSSRKRYRAASTDYQAPAAWQWFAGSYILDANCRITEIPLDLRFDVLSRPTYTVFTSLGINSLLMRNERYSYDWTMSGQTFTKTAQVLDGSNHFLSVVNLSVGIERALGGRWSAQVEPFWQVPLAGVGAGQVRLNSAGAAFSLKFGLVR